MQDHHHAAADLCDAWCVVLDALQVVMHGNEELSAETPLEVVVPTADGWLGVAAGPAQLLITAAHPSDLLVAVSFGDDSEAKFVAVLRHDRVLTVLRHAPLPAPWRDALAELANQARAMLSELDPEQHASASETVH